VSISIVVCCGDCCPENGLGPAKGSRHRAPGPRHHAVGTKYEATITSHQTQGNSQPCQNICLDSLTFVAALAAKTNWLGPAEDNTHRAPGSRHHALGTECKAATTNHQTQGNKQPSHNVSQYHVTFVAALAAEEHGLGPAEGSKRRAPGPRHHVLRTEFKATTINQQTQGNSQRINASNKGSTSQTPEGAAGCAKRLLRDIVKYEKENTIKDQP